MFWSRVGLALLLSVYSYEEEVELAPSQQLGLDCPLEAQGSSTGTSDPITKDWPSFPLEGAISQQHLCCTFARAGRCSERTTRSARYPLLFPLRACSWASHPPPCPRKPLTSKAAPHRGRHQCDKHPKELINCLRCGAALAGSYEWKYILQAERRPIGKDEQAARADHCGIQVGAARGCPGNPTVSPRPLFSQASLLTSFPKLANPTYLPEPSPRSLLPAYSKLTE